MSTQLKEEATRLIDGLPDDATWDDLMYAIHVRQAVEEGIAEADAGLGIPVEEVWKRFGFEP